ncbi:MAG: hypothetical protein RR665_01925 [Malacoplasma sp.]
MKQNKPSKNNSAYNRLVAIIFSFYLLSLLLSILLSHFLNDWPILYAYLFSLPFFLITFVFAIIMKKNKKVFKIKNRFYLTYMIYFIGKNLLFFLPFIIIYILLSNNHTFLSVWGALIGVIIQQVINLSYLFYNEEKEIKLEKLSEPI